MTDLESYRAQGVRVQWQARLSDGTLVPEFDPDTGAARPLASVDWAGAQEIQAIPLDAGVTQDPVVLPMSAGARPLWFHRTSGVLGPGGGFVPGENIDGVGTVCGGLRRCVLIYADGHTAEEDAPG